MTRPRPRRALAVVALLTGLGVAGCGGSDDSDPIDAPPTTSPTSPTTETTTPSPTPTTQAADGPALKLPPATVNLPEDWKLTDLQASYQASGGAPDSSSLISLGSLPAIATTDTPDDLARFAARHDYGNKQGKVLPEATIDGVSMGHVSGVYLGTYTEQFITNYRGDTVDIKFDLGVDDYSSTQRRELVDAVMASWTWR